MTDINLAFCRHLMRGTHAEVRSLFPGVNVVKDTGVLRSGAGPRPQYLFELVYQGKNYSTYVSADNAYEARHKGWGFVIMACSSALADFARDLAQAGE